MFFIIYKNNSHFLSQEIGKDNLKTNVLPKTIEKYMRFAIEKTKKKDIEKELPLVLINSVHFSNNSVWKSFIMKTMKDYHDF